MKLLNIVKHLGSITEHKLLVMWNCFQVGLYRQGLLHDLSKYSPEEFCMESAIIREPEAPMRQNGK